MIRKRSRDFARAVNRSVINDNHFERDSSLRDERFEAECEASLFVPCGNDNGHDGCFEGHECTIMGKVLARIGYYSFVRFYPFFLILLLAALTTTACYQGSKPSGIGGAAPDFTVQDSDRTVTLSQFHGKIVVLNFWAS